MLGKVRTLSHDLPALVLGFIVSSLSLTVLSAARSSDPLRTAAPSASLLSPTSGQIVSGNVMVSATASESTDALQFQLSGANLGPSITAGACSMNWNTAAVSDGNYVLSVLAFDAAGNTMASSPVTVTVSNSAPQITDVALSTPTSSSVVITWTTNQLSTSGVDYGAGGLTSSLPVNWGLVTQHVVTLSGLSPGTSYQFRVTSWNAVGLAGLSSVLTFTTAASGAPGQPDSGIPALPPGALPSPPSTTLPPGALPEPSPLPVVTPPAVPSTPPLPPPAPEPTPSPTPTPAPDPTTIDSVAVDPVLGVLANVPLALQSARQIVARTVTDDVGRYQFTGLLPGNYQVYALYAGAKILVLDFTVK